MMTGEAEKVGPLAGVLVVEMGQLIAGPFCGQLLGDMGAEVIKIETPGSGDPMREWGRGDQPLWWEVIARNKKSVTLNLRTEAGQALARRLIAKADILVENFRPGTLEKWGMAPAMLHAENPRLIITRMSGYGQTGPYAQRTGYGLIGEAMGGWRHIVGEPDRPPSRMGISIGDSLCATYGCLGAVAALRHRDQTGQGQIIDASLYESVLQVMESLVVDYSVTGYVRERTGAILPGIAPSNVYRCSDGDYLIGANQDSVFERLCQAMGQPELAHSEAYESHENRGRNQAELDRRITEWTSVRTVDEVEAAMIAHGIPAGRIYRAPDMLTDPQFAARNSIVDLAHPRYGSIRMQNTFPLFSKTPGSVRRLAPAVPGQDNQQVLGELLGLGESQLEELARAGTI
jgi:crotonobetainyl-CoA:carnitine CoA-transferase CaiB-like acyl-CoA transferase